MTPAQGLALIFCAASLPVLGVAPWNAGGASRTALAAAGCAAAALAALGLLAALRRFRPLYVYGVVFLLALSYTLLRAVPPDLPRGEISTAVLRLTGYPRVRSRDRSFPARVRAFTAGPLREPHPRADSAGSEPARSTHEGTAGGVSVLARFPLSGPRLRRGDTVRAEGVFAELPFERAPAYARYLRSSGLAALFEARAGGFSVLRRSGPLSPVRPAGRLREYIFRVNKRLLPPTQGAVATALLTGERGGITGPVSEAFRCSGTMHILAISGLHVGFISLFLYFGLRLARMNRYAAAAVAAAVLVLFMVFIGNRPSVRRASLMALCGIACVLLDRDRNYLNALALAFCALWLANPLSLANPGFLLSFLAAFGILLLTPRLYPRLSRVMPRFLAGSLSTTMAVQLFIFPVLASFFGSFPYVNLAANLLIVPLTGASLGTGILTLLAYPLFLPAAVLLAEVNAALIAAMVHCARLFALVPPLQVAAFPPALVPPYLAAVAAACVLLVRPGVSGEGLRDARECTSIGNGPGKRA
ncbi:MAG: ComEC/Rec2 family competence protein [Spirochaetota bacterium]